MKKSHSVRVVIADDHSIVREGLTAVINREPDMEVIAQARNWPGAVEQALQNRPEIALLDLHMRDMEPAEGVAILREKVPATQIIIFSAFGTDEEVYQVLRAGVRGYVLKGESGREEVLRCIRAVARGEMWIHPVAAARLAERMTMPNIDVPRTGSAAPDGGGQIQQGNRVVAGCDGRHGKSSRKPYTRQTRRERARRGHPGGCAARPGSSSRNAA